ncbi:hypothetical protein [Streptomyces sp. NPDC091416]|uniref:hypothetical protein n=1 Tax=Streptomyces sp. NPDC091416 TaxID=3366003 RepID=UPI003817C5AD
MESDPGTGTDEAAALLAAIVVEAYSSRPSLLLEEDTVALAARVEDAGVRPGAAGALLIRPDALVPVLTYHLVTGALFDVPACLERYRALRDVVETAEFADPAAAETFAALRADHARLTNELGAALYLGHVRGGDAGQLHLAARIARLAMEISPDPTHWRSAARTLLAVGKTLSEVTREPSWLTEAIELGRLLHARISAPNAVTDDIDVDLLANFGGCLLARGTLAEAEHDLAEAVDVLRLSVRISAGRPGEALARLNLSQALYSLAEKREDSAGADEAFVHVRAAVELVEPDNWQRHRFFRALGDGWARRADDESGVSSSSVEAAEAAARAYAEALRTANEDRPGLLVLLARSAERVFAVEPASAVELISEVCETAEDGWVADALFAEGLANAFGHNRQRRCIDTAIDHAKRSLDRSSRHPHALSAFGLALSERGRVTGSVPDSEAAAAALREALERSTDRDNTRRSARRLSAVLVRLYEHGEDSALPGFRLFLDALRDAGATSPDLDTRKALARSLGARFARTRSPSHGQEAAAQWRAATESEPDDTESVRELSSLLMDLGMEGDQDAAGEALALAWRLRRGDPANLARLNVLAMAARVAGEFHEHVDAVREVVAEVRTATAPPWTGPELSAVLSHVHLLHILFEETDDMDALTEAIAVARRLVSQPGASPRHRARARLALAQGLIRQQEFSGDVGDLDEAIGTLQRIGETEHVDGIGSETGPSPHRAGSPQGGEHIATLASGLTGRYGITGVVTDLDRAIALHESVLNDLSPADRATALSNLGMALRLRAAHHGDPAELRRAYEVSLEAVTLTPAGHRERPRRLIHFASAAIGLAQEDSGHPGSRAVADLAVAAAREAVATAPDGHSEELRYAQSLAMALLVRQRTGADDLDLREATHTYAHIVDRTRPGHTQHSMALLNLARAHQHRGMGPHGSEGALESAASYARRAAATRTAGWVHHAETRILLARILETLADRTGRASHLREAAGHLRDAAQAPDGPPDGRLRAAVHWGHLESSRQRQPRALEAWTTAVGLLPIAVWFGLGRSLRESHLRRYEGIARHAAAAALDAGQPETAVALLEQGRNVLWAGVLRTRTSLDDVRATHPDLAARLEEVRGRLDALDRAAGGRSEPVLRGQPEGS